MGLERAHPLEQLVDRAEGTHDHDAARAGRVEPAFRVQNHSPGRAPAVSDGRSPRARGEELRRPPELLERGLLRPLLRTGRQALLQALERGRE